MLSLLSPKNILIAVLIAVCIGFYVEVASYKVKLAQSQSDLGVVKEELKSCLDANVQGKIALDNCAGNLLDVKKAYDEQVVAFEKYKVYKTKWKKADADQAALPPPAAGEPCISGGKIDEDHKGILVAYVAEFNRVRGKVKRPAGADNSGKPPSEILPKAGASDIK